MSRMKLPFSVNTGPSFPSARRRLIFEAPNKRISFSTWERACGNTYRYGVFAPQFADKLTLIDNDVSLATAFNEEFLLKHGSATSFDEVVLRIHFVCTVECPIRTLIPQSSLRQAKLYTCHRNFGRCRNDFYMQRFLFNSLS